MFRKSLALAAAIAGIAGIAYAQGSMGFWSNWPLFGQSYCSSYVNGSCVQTVPAGETALQGSEVVPMDTHLPNGQFPQSQIVPIDIFAHLGEGAERNFLRGSDFFTNLWQRGTTFSSLTPTTTTMTADGWGVYSSGNTVTITQDTTAADLSAPLQINAAMKITRPSGTNTTAICVSQVLSQKDSVKFIGKQAVFSFYADPLTGFLSTNNNIVATLAVYTAGDSATPGTNTDAFAKGTITGYTVINPTSATTLTAPSISLAAGWNRYSVTGAVPLTVPVSGTATAVVGIGVQICTAVYPASTGVAGDGFLIANAMLEQTNPGTTTTIPGPGGTTVTIPATLAGISPSGFTRRNLETETALELSFTQVIKEPAASISVGPSGQGASTTTCVLSIPAAVPMREIPTATYSTVGGSTWTITHVVTNTALAASGLATTSGGNLTNMFNITATATSAALTAGQTCTLTGAGGGATITESSEP